MGVSQQLTRLARELKLNNNQTIRLIGGRTDKAVNNFRRTSRAKGFGAPDVLEFFTEDIYKNGVVIENIENIIDPNLSNRELFKQIDAIDPNVINDIIKKRIERSDPELQEAALQMIGVSTIEEVDFRNFPDGLNLEDVIKPNTEPKAQGV